MHGAAVKRGFEADAPEADNVVHVDVADSGVAVAVAVHGSFRPGGAGEEEGLEGGIASANPSQASLMSSRTLFAL